MLPSLGDSIVRDLLQSEADLLWIGDDSAVAETNGGAEVTAVMERRESEYIAIEESSANAERNSGRVVGGHTEESRDGGAVEVEVRSVAVGCGLNLGVGGDNA